MQAPGLTHAKQRIDGNVHKTLNAKGNKESPYASCDHTLLYFLQVCHYASLKTLCSSCCGSLNHTDALHV